jgi:PAS domain S-box-containing protein
MNRNDSSSSIWRRRALRYSLAFVAVAAGFGLRAGLTALAGEGLPTYITFYPLVMGVALLGGVGPGLLATLTTALAVDYWIIPPEHELAIANLADAVGLAFFTGMGVFMSVFSELYRRARQKAEPETEIFLRNGQETPPHWSRQGLLLNAGLVVSLAILAAAGLQSVRNIRAVAESDKWERHSYVVIQGLDKLLSALKDTETGQRGYLLTGEEKYLEPYLAGLDLAQTNLVSLKQLTRDNVRQQQRLAGIEVLIQEKFVELHQTIELRRTQGLPAALAVVSSDKGKILMDQIRERVAEAQDEEGRLLQQRTVATSANAGKTLQALLAGGVLSFLLLTTVFLFLKQENNRRTEAEAEVRHHRDHLQGLVAARTAELRETNESLRQQREWLRVTLTSIGDAVLATDTAGHITFLNPVAELLTGWKESQALGQPAQSVFRIFNEQTRAPGEDIVARVLREGQIVALANHTALIARDGHEVPIEDSAAPIKDGGGTVSGVVLVFHDVTQNRQAQEALRASRTLLQTVIEGTTDAIYVKDPQGRYLLFNSSAARATGKRADEVLGKDDTFLFPPDQARVVMEGDRAVMAGGKIVTYEENVTVASGELVTYLSTKGPLLDGQGRRIGLFGVARDVTVRKRAEEALRQSEERYRMMFDTMIEGFCIIEVLFDADDRPLDYRFLEINPAFETQTGLKNAQGKRMRELAPEHEGHWFEIYGKVALTGEPARFVNEAKALNRCYDVSAYRVGGRDSRKVAILFNDITERKRAEEAVRASGERLELALISCRMATFDWDIIQNKRIWSDGVHSLLGTKPETFTGKAEEFFQVIHPEDRSAVQAALARAVETNGVYETEYRAVWPDGSIYHIAARGKVHCNEAGQAVLLTGVCWDITERRRTEEALLDSETRFRVIASNTPDHIAVQDRDLRYTYVINPQLGIKEEDMTGKTDEEILPAADAARLTQIKLQVLKTGQPAHLEMPLLSRSGQQQFFDGTYVPKYNAKGQIDGLIGYFKNITERKRIEEALRFLARCGATSPGEGFFKELARYLAQLLGMNFVCIDRLEEGWLTARTLAVFRNGRFVDNVSHTLKDTPCADTVGRTICCFPRNASELFPRDAVLQKLQGESYLGTTLWNSQGQPIGLIAAISREPLADTRLAESILELVAVRAATELERQQANEALQKLNEELEQRVVERTVEVRAASLYARSLLEASLDPLVTISLEGKITDVNKATELVTGLPCEQLIGSNFSDYFTEPKKAETGYQKVLAEGQVRDYPLTIRHVSGCTADVLYNATVYRNEAGTVQGVFAAARDITERMEAERRRDFTNSLLALFAHKTSSKEYLDSAVDVIRRWCGCQALGIRIVDGNREIPYEASAGFEPDFLELENRLSLERDNCCCVRAIMAAFEGQDRPLLTSAGSFRCDDAIAVHNQLPPEKRAQNRGNCVKFGFASVAIIPIRYRDEVIGAIHMADRRPGRFPPAVAEFIESMSPLIGEAIRRFQTEAELAKHRGQLEELVGQRTGELESANLHLKSEIAQRAEAEAALRRLAKDLERSNRDLEQFAYVASHDLQEPLRAVGGYVKLLQHRFPEKLDAAVREYINGAAAGAERMQRLITDLLAFSRVGTRNVAFAPADLNALLNDALTNLQVTIKEVGAKVTSDPLPSLPVDATQITQIFQNLIGNAIKFHSDLTPVIHVGARKEPGRWLFWVRDNGIGIEPKYSGRIFQIFQRLHTRKQYPGTGIGLAICKKIVERHGGTIWVESQPGQGSTFYFSIPEPSAKMEHVV